MPYINSAQQMMSQPEPNQMTGYPNMMGYPDMMGQSDMMGYPDMMGQQMYPSNNMMPQQMMPQQMYPSNNMMSPQMSQFMPGLENGLEKLPMPIVDLKKDNLLSDTAPTALDTNLNSLVGGSVNDFFLKKKK